MATTEDPTQTQVSLRTGEDYINSLKDDREVYYKGERVEDVTTHEATAGGIAAFLGRPARAVAPCR